MDREWRAGSDGQGMGGRLRWTGVEDWVTGNGVCAIYMYYSFAFLNCHEAIPSHSQDVWLKDEKKCYTHQDIQRLSGFSFSFPSLLFC